LALLALCWRFVGAHLALLALLALLAPLRLTQFVAFFAYLGHKNFKGIRGPKQQQQFVLRSLMIKLCKTHKWDPYQVPNSKSTPHICLCH
jgi:hypothetical protein